MRFCLLGTFEDLGKGRAINITMMGKSMIIAKASTGGIFFSLRKQHIFPMQGPWSP